MEIEVKEYEEKGHIWIVRDIEDEAYKELVNRDLGTYLKNTKFFSK